MKTAEEREGIVLISPPGLKTLKGLQMHTPNPPLGLAYIAGALKAAGYRYKVIDAVGEAISAIRPFEMRRDMLVQGYDVPEIIERIPANTKAIAISCMFSTLWPLCKKIIFEARRAFPRALLVGGGEHFTAVPEYCLKTSPLDVAVLGEGEDTFLQLLEVYFNGGDMRTLQGICFRDGDKIVSNGLSPRKRDVNRIPWPDWDSFPIEEYIRHHQVNGVNRGRSMPILATRGCPFACTFCSNEFMWTQRWFPRDPKDIADEMEFYIRKYNVQNFDFQDLTAFVGRQWTISFCEELLRRNLRVTWQLPSGTRSEGFDDEVAALLYRAGCRNLSFAPESGDPEVLRAVKKQVKLDRMLQAMRAAIRHRLKLGCFIVIGFPMDTHRSLWKTWRLILRMAWIGVHDIAVSKFIPYPGSPLFRQLQAEGKISMDDEFFVSPMDFYTKTSRVYTDHITPLQLYLYMLFFFFTFYGLSFLLRPWRPILALTKALLTGREETRYAKWFRDMVITRPQWLWSSMRKRFQPAASL